MGVYNSLGLIEGFAPNPWLHGYYYPFNAALIHNSRSSMWLVIKMLVLSSHSRKLDDRTAYVTQVTTASHSEELDPT